MRGSWLLIGAILAFGCGRDSDGSGKGKGNEPSAPPPPPPDAALAKSEILGRKLCPRAAPPAELASVAGVEELVMAAGYSRAEAGRLYCLYLWPVSGTPEVTVDVRIDCRELRPTTEDLAAHWDAGGAQPSGLERSPAEGVHQHFRDLQDPPCHLSVTTGFLATDRSSSLADLVAGKLDSKLARALERGD